MALGLINLLIIIFLFKQLNLSILQSDPYMYLLQSKKWWEPDLHLPVYAFILWAFNLLTLGILPEIFLLHLVAALTWIASLLSFISVMKILEIEQRSRLLLLIAYAFFPLIGLTYAAWPIADSSVWLLANLLLIACLKRDWALLTLALGFGLLLHKFVWGICAMVAVYAFIALGFPWYLVLASAIPSIAFLFSVAIQGGGVTWLLQHDVERHFVSYSQLPIFDGLVGTFMQPGIVNKLKGCLLLAIFIFEFFIFVKALLRRQWLALAFVSPLLILGAIANQWLAITVLRFGKITILPLILLLASKDIKLPSYLTNPKTILLTLLVLIGTQYSYAVYMERFFRAGGTLDQKLQIEKETMEKKGLPTYNRGAEDLSVTP